MADDQDLPRLPFRRHTLLDVAPEYRDLQHERPIAKVLTPAGDEAWLATSHDHVKALFAEERLGRSHPDPDSAARVSTGSAAGGPMGSYAAEMEEHARLRRLLAPAFSARRMATLRTRVQDLVDDLLDRMAALSPPVDLRDVFSFPLPVLATCELFGMPVADRDQLLAWTRLAATLFDTDEADCAAGGEALAEIVSYTQELVEAKRTTPGDDVISDLVAADVDASEIVGLAAVLFAGHEITVARIDFGVLLLLTNADQLHAVTADPSLLSGAVEEILRMSAPVSYGLPRYAHTDIDIDGVTIRAGDAVLLAGAVANRDPQAFPDAERFDVTRRPNPHLSFGHGRSFCLGAGLARVELEVAFGTLFRRFPTLALAAPLDDLQLRITHPAGGVVRLPVTW